VIFRVGAVRRPWSALRGVLSKLTRLSGRLWRSLPEVMRGAPVALTSYIFLLTTGRGRPVIVWEASDIHFQQHFGPVLVKFVQDYPNTATHVVSGLGSRVCVEPEDLPANTRLFPWPSRFVPGASIYVSPSNFRCGPRRAYRIHLGHGLGAKYVTYPPEAFDHFHEWFVQGPLRMAFLQSSLSQSGVGRSALLTPVGYPPSDGLVHARQRSLTAAAEIKNEVVVLFAPSWEHYGALRSERWGLQVLDTLLSLPGVKVKVRLHPISLTPRGHPQFEAFAGNVDWRHKLREYESNPGFAGLDSPTTSNVRSLLGSDILVTDYSSIGLDWLILDRPLIVLDCGTESFKRLGGNGATPEALASDLRYNGGRSCGFLVSSPDCLGEAVEHARLQPSALSPKRRAAQTQLLYNPGFAAQAAAQRLRTIQLERAAKPVLTRTRFD
jgi:hypothetical protein